MQAPRGTCSYRGSEGRASRRRATAAARSADSAQAAVIRAALEAMGGGADGSVGLAEFQGSRVGSGLDESAAAAASDANDSHHKGALGLAAWAAGFGSLRLRLASGSSSSGTPVPITGPQQGSSNAPSRAGSGPAGASLGPHDSGSIRVGRPEATGGAERPPRSRQPSPMRQSGYSTEGRRSPEAGQTRYLYRLIDLGSAIGTLEAAEEVGANLSLALQTYTANAFVGTPAYASPESFVQQVPHAALLVCSTI
jgi:hypothetical protein